MASLPVCSAPAPKVHRGFPRALFRARFARPDCVAVLGVVTLVTLVSLRGLCSPDIDTPDSAMHLLDGIFFYDLLRDHPHADLTRYALDYYRQYPALGFSFWPPLFPIVLGVVFLLIGPGLPGARLCLFLFGLLFALSFYALLRGRFSAWLTFAATAVAVTVPGMSRSFNELLLELPAIAMMCFAAAIYQSMVAGLERGSRRLLPPLLCGVACAAVIYTKQPGWFLYPALAIDLALCHPRLLRRRQVWVAASTLVALSLPLAIFTVTWGRANLAQSIGSKTQTLMTTYHALPRTSLDAWWFYPRLAASSLNPVVLVLVVAALLLAVTRRGFLRENAFWFTWFALAYATFSFYDNRQERFSAFWWPAWVALAAAALHYATRAVPAKHAWLAPALFLLPCPLQLWQCWHTQYAEYSGAMPAIARLFAYGIDGNLLLLGDQNPLVVTLIRVNDPRRRVHVIRGDRLLPSQELNALCQRYRIATVLMVSADPAPVLAANRELAPIESQTFSKSGKPQHALAYRYLGPVNSIAATVALPAAH